MGGLNSGSKALDVLTVRNQCNVLWNPRNFKCLSFLRHCKIYFTSTDLLLYSKENGMQVSYTTRFLNVCLETSRPHTGQGEVALY